MQAFLSYTRIDDEFFGGAITSLRRAIELGVQVITGDKKFKIFQDIDGIELGQKWRERLDEALSGARLLIPIITPLFFSSDACRDELKKFIRHEKDLGRNDLILPIYFVTTPSLENPDQEDTNDPLAQEIRTLALEINSRQRRDWRPNADLPINNPDVRREVLSLSEEIARAVQRASDLSARLDQQLRQGAEIIKSEEADTLSAAPKLVLWVDDRPENNIAERAAMQKYNIGFVLATSTAQAKNRIRAGASFDAIISDMSRPPDPRAGYTLLKAVRDSGSRVPYFIYAGSRAPEHQKEALARGAQGTTNIASELIDMVLRSFALRTVEPHEIAQAQERHVSVEAIRILFLSANPTGTVSLKLEEEAREIETKIRASAFRDSLELITRWAVRPDDLLQSLNQYKPHIVHFSGHGSPTEEIILLDIQGVAKPVSKEALVSLFRTLKDNIRVVLLNACYSRPQAEAITSEIDCSIGMSRAIGDYAAIVFAAAFYRAIGFGRSVREAFDQGKTALLLEGIPEDRTPALLTRSSITPESIHLIHPR
jgi:CheY-like chemotaxis protein